MKKIIGSIKTKLELLKPSHGFSWKKIKSKDIEINVLQKDNDNFLEDGNYIIYIAGYIFHSHLPVSNYAKLLMSSIGSEELVLKDLEGQFAVFIWNKKEQELKIITDRLGLYPVYILQDGEKLIFSSDLDILLMQSKFRLNPNALAEYFTYGYTTGNKTFVLGVSNLEPGSINVFREGVCKTKKYFTLDVTKTKGCSKEIYVERIADSLEKAAAIRALSKEVLMHLSGGFDTRLLLACFLKQKKNVTVVTTYNLSEFESDLIYAKELCRRYKIKQIICKKDYMGAFPSKFQTDFFDYKFAVEVKKSRFKPLMNEKKRMEFFIKPTFAGKFGSETLASMISDELVNTDKEIDCESYFSHAISDEITSKPCKIVKEILNEQNIDKSHKKSYLFITQCLRNYLFAYAGDGWARPSKFFTKQNIYTFLDTDFLKAVWSSPEAIFEKSQMYPALFNKVDKSLMEIPWTYNLLFRPKCSIFHPSIKKIKKSDESFKKTKEAINAKCQNNALNSIDKLPIYKNLDLIKREAPLQLSYFDMWLKQFREHIQL